MRRGEQVIRWNRNGDAPAEGPWPGYEVQRPTRQPSVASDVAVPFLQSVITALVLGTGATTLLWGFFDVAYWPTWPIAMACAFVLAWLWRLGAVSETLWTIERVLGTDITGDQVVGRPTEAHIVTITGPGASTMTPAERKRAQFITFIRAIGATGDTSRERFESTLGRQRYEEFRDALLQVGWARWIDPDNHRQGWELVEEPEVIIQGVM